SQNSICRGSCIEGLPHGIHFESKRYILFQGNAYDSLDPQNEIVEINPTMHLAGITEVLFDLHSGDATTTPSGIWDIVLSDAAGHVSTTTFNSEGRISWTH